MNKLNILLTGAIIAIALFAFTSKGTESSEAAKPAGTWQFTSFTVVESIVPNGMGRSRIINALETRSYKDFTTVRTEDDNERNKSDRDEIRVKNFEETKLLNFFNIGGIRFQNIAANDAVISDKVTTMLNEGWEIVSVVAGVESKGSSDDSDGIYITRFYFKKQI
jgi:hypothetical protein